MEDVPTPTARNTFFLIVNCVLLALGISCGPLIMRQYYLAGGTRVWFASWLETAGWPIILIPLIISFLRRRSTTPGLKLFTMKPRLFIGSAVLGALTGLDDYMYAHGVASLPVSTSSILIATQLAFMAVFAYIIVKHKFTAYTVNSVVLLTVGALVLGLHSHGDRPVGVSNKEYWTGFFMVLLAAVLYGFVLPMVELMLKKAKQTITYSLIMETQMVMCLFATLFCTVGMFINKDFQAIPREAKNDKDGMAKYYLVVTSSALVWQFFFLGAVGVVYYSSSLLSGTIISVFLPVTEIFAIIFYHEKFQAEKGLSLFLSLWGFTSYFWGEIKLRKKMKKNKLNNSNTQTTETQLVIQTVAP